MRLTEKNEFFEYVLPCQNVIGDNQASEIQLGYTEYTTKKYIVGEAIKQFGLIEDILEKWNIEDLDKFIDNQLDEIYKLKQELAELKQKAIVPKFVVGQEIWYCHIGKNKIYSRIVEDVQWRPVNGMYYRIPNLQRDYYWIREDELFATKEEAEKFLRKALGDR